MVRNGKLTIEDMKRGKEMLDLMSRPENYAVNDPVLGRGPGGYVPTTPVNAPRPDPR